MESEPIITWARYSHPCNSIGSIGYLSFLEVSLHYALTCSGFDLILDEWGYHSVYEIKKAFLFVVSCLFVLQQRGIMNPCMYLSILSNGDQYNLDLLHCLSLTLTMIFCSTPPWHMQKGKYLLCIVPESDVPIWIQRKTKRRRKVYNERYLMWQKMTKVQFKLI